MLSIYDLTIFDSENEHDLTHNSEHERQFSDPKIYDAKGNLDKRWYVYFSFRHPKTGKMVRSKNIYGKTNRYKSKVERYSILNVYRKRLLKLLNEGYIPHGHNQKRYDSKAPKAPKVEKAVKASKTKVTELKKSNKSKVIPANDQGENIKMTVEDSISFVLKLKSNLIGASTMTDYQSRCHRLIKWLKKNYENIQFIDEIEKKHVIGFLNETSMNTSARNRNNYRTCFSSIWQSLEDNDIVKTNFIKHIKPLPTKPNRNKTYSLKEQKEIFNYLEKNDKVLLLFIQFISYNLLRPIEVCRLRVKDINLEQNIVQFRAKNKILKTKLIPEIMLSKIPDLSDLDPDALLFTPEGFGMEWSATEVNRRGYFTNRFKKVIKDHFGFNDNYGLYSFRHTFITKLYRALSKKSSPYQAKSELMQITGHTSMEALEKYLRDVDAELPNDYSNLL